MRFLIDRLEAWMTRKMQPVPGPIRLGHERIYIIPDKSGLTFGLLLTLMFLGASNESLGLGFVLTFLLGGLAFTALLATFRNLFGLTILAGPSEPVFAGQTARIAVGLHNQGDRERWAVTVDADRWSGETGDLPPGEILFLALTLAHAPRGVQRPGRFRVHTRFPLGIFFAWSRTDLGLEAVVYPRPESGRVPDPPIPPGRGAFQRDGPGEEDFRGLRNYRPGDPPKRIAWKKSVGMPEPLVKSFAGAPGGILSLTWEATAGRDVEARLSRLCRWVLDAEKDGESYGLTLPGVRLPPNRGTAHRRACLEALARYGSDS